MTPEEMLNSDDIEVAKLGAAILREKKGKSYVANLIRKYGKYRFIKGIGLSKIIKSNWNHFSLIESTGIVLIEM